MVEINFFSGDDIKDDLDIRKISLFYSIYSTLVEERGKTFETVFFSYLRL